jgi:hypothetical protein
MAEQLRTNTGRRRLKPSACTGVNPRRLANLDELKKPLAHEAYGVQL